MAQIDLSEVLQTDAGTPDPKIPEIVWSVMEDLPLYIPDESEQAEGEVYQRVKQGHCMTCNGSLGELTMLCVNRAGIVMVFCGGACYTDMQVTGWIEEQYEDLVTKIKFRGGVGDEAEE